MSLFSLLQITTLSVLNAPQGHDGAGDYVVYALVAGAAAVVIGLGACKSCFRPQVEDDD
jgi:hypothetical protein